MEKLQKGIGMFVDSEIPPEGHGEYSAAAVEWDVEEGGDADCSQGNRDADFGVVY